MRRLISFWILFASCADGPAPRETLHDYRGIIHCHSLYSHDSKGTYEEILAAAKAAKVDFICMTDHPPKGDPGLSLREGWKGIHDGVLFIQGAEYSDNILGLGLKEPIQFKDRRGTIRAIHDQGGVAIACHPEGIKDWSEFDEADGMEIYNVHAAFTKLRADPKKLGAALRTAKEDPEHSFQHLQELDPAVIAKWDEINLKRRFTGIAGNDSHQNVNILGLQLDPYPRAFRFVSTHVMASELTEKAVLNALRRGPVWVVFDQMWPASISDGSDKMPGEKEAVRIFYYRPEKSSELKRLEFEGSEAIGLKGLQRSEIWILRPEGKLPWILSTWYGRPGDQ